LIGSENFREDPAQSEIALLSHHEPNFLQAGLELGFEVDGQFSSQKKIDRSQHCILERQLARSIMIRSPTKDCAFVAAPEED